MIREVLDGMHSDIQYRPEILYQLDYNNIVMFPYETVEPYLSINYGGYYYDDIYSFGLRFQNHKNVNLYNLYKKYNVLHLEYEPLENYNMTESTTSNFGNRVESENNNINNLFGRKTINDVHSFNPSNDIESYVTNSDKSTTDEYTDSSSMQSGKIINAYTDSISVTRKGNLGVTTSQQMAESELKLRTHEILSDFIKEFIKNNCFLI